jgi:nucleoside 2-deoxyribosyltransferase
VTVAETVPQPVAHSGREKMAQINREFTGTAWEIGYAYGKNIQIFGLRTDARIAQRADEPINLMILESLSELSPTIEQLVHTLRYAERP